MEGGKEGEEEHRMIVCMGEGGGEGSGKAEWMKFFGDYTLDRTQALSL